MKRVWAIIAVLLLCGAGMLYLQFPRERAKPTVRITDRPAKTPSPSPIIPTRHVIENTYHTFQTFNNCGPAALSMALSYSGIQVSQEELGYALRPYQVAGGDNDDKSVTLDELAQKAKDYGLIPYHRPAGTDELVKRFIASGIPVITRTLLHETDDIGHYRIIKGYDDETQAFLQDDSLQGKNLTYSYADYNRLWKPYNYEYLVLVPKEKAESAEAILGENLDEDQAWKNALRTAQDEQQESDSFYPIFNESIALYHLGDYKGSTNRFEAISTKLPFRTLWYQIEPILAYQKLKQYDKVFSLTDAIITNQNRAFSELYFIRGQIYEEQKEREKAKAEYEKAVYYNTNFQPAKDALTRL